MAASLMYFIKALVHKVVIETIYRYFKIILVSFTTPAGVIDLSVMQLSRMVLCSVFSLK